MVVKGKKTPVSTENVFQYHVNGILVVISKRTAGNMDYRFGPPKEVAAHRLEMAKEFEINPSSFAFMTAQMGSNAVLVSKRDGGKGVPCDAMFTSKAGVFPTLLPGDCCPVFLLHRDVWGIVHAGRANARTVIPASIAWLKEKFGAGSSALMAIIGPTIRDTYVFPHEKKHVIKSQLDDPAWEGHITDEADGYHVHLAGCVMNLLRNEGVIRVIDLGMDTASGDFFSHSLSVKTGVPEGRHACFIGQP